MKRERGRGADEWEEDERRGGERGRAEPGEIKDRKDIDVNFFTNKNSSINTNGNKNESFF